MKNKFTLDLKKQAGIITGAAAGMGKAIAERLAEDGASLVLADINEDALGKIHNDFSASSDNIIFQKADVTKEDDVSKMIESCIDSYSKIDFIVSNAGIVGPYDFEETSGSDWDNVFAVNTKAGFLCAKYALPYMKKQKKGRIIFNSSTNGGKPGGYVIAYRSSKAALIMLARSLALNAAPYGITVNTVCPGVTMTPMQRKLTESLISGKGQTFEEYVAQREKRVPMGRFTDVHDIADMVEFLISDNAQFVTGQALYVNGGEWS